MTLVDTADLERRGWTRSAPGRVRASRLATQQAPTCAPRPSRPTWIAPKSFRISLVLPPSVVVWVPDDACRR